MIVLSVCAQTNSLPLAPSSCCLYNTIVWIGIFLFSYVAIETLDINITKANVTFSVTEVPDKCLNMFRC